MMHLLSFVMVILHYFRMLIICEAVHFFPSDKNEITTYLNLPPEAATTNYFLTQTIFFGGELGCDQIYSLDLAGIDTLNDQNDLSPRRISYDYASVEHPEVVSKWTNDNDNKTNIVFSSNAVHSAGYNNESKTLDNNRCNATSTVEQKLIKNLMDICWKRALRHSDNPLCKYWFDIEDIYPKNELIGWLDPKMDIFLSQFDDGILFANAGDDADPMLLSLSHQPLFQGPYFDGFPAISLKHHNSHVLYIISIGQHQKVPQLWQIDIPNGDNKKQLTYTDAWKLGPINVSPDGHKLIFICIPNGNGMDETKLNAISQNQSLSGIYNVSSQQLCTFELEKNELKILDFGTMQNYQLYWFSSPTFISDEKILFSAKKVAVPEMLEPGYLDHSESIGTKKNTALFMSNFNGTNLERITDYRPKNNHVAFDASTNRLAWITTETFIINYHDFVNYIYIANLHIPPNMERKCTTNNDASASYEIVNVVQLTNLSTNKFALRPTFSADMESIMYELVSIRSTSPAGKGSNITRMVMHSEIRRMSIGSIVNQYKKGNFASFGNKSRETREWRCISSPLEHAAGVANFDPEGTLLAYSAMPKSNSNNRHRHIADNDKCDAKMEEEFERKPILEQMLNYRKFYDGMDIYKFNAYGQMIHPIIQREYFDGDFVMHVTNETFCKMVFSSADLKDAKKWEEGVQFNLWSANYCAFTGWLYHPFEDINGKWEKEMRKLSTDIGQHSYQGEATFSHNGAELAFIQTTMPNKSDLFKYNTIIRGCDNSYIVNMNQTEIFTMDFSGTNNVHQITKLNATSLTPKFLPNGNDLIIFSSNYGGGGEEQQSSYVNMKNWPFSLFIANRNGNCVKKVQISTANIAEMYGNNHAFPDAKSTKSDDLLIIWSSGQLSNMNLFIGKLVIH